MNEGKVIVISGGSDGVGKAVARKLASNNKVIILARGEEKLKKVSEEIGSDFRVCDISDYNQCENVMKSIIDAYGQIEVLVNNAGVWIEGELKDNDPEKILRVVNINTIGTINLTRTTIPFMIEKKSGSIINIISLAGVSSKTGRTVYSASKWAITGFTKSLSKELAPQGIKVTGIYPGYMTTNLFEEYGDDRDKEKSLDLEEVADTIEFILSRSDKTHILSVELKNVDY